MPSFVELHAKESHVLPHSAASCFLHHVELLMMLGC